jgi:hypothetical protein
VARKALTCPDCGSSEPEPEMEGELVARPDGGAGVPRRCERCEEASEMALVLSPRRQRPSACTRWGISAHNKRPDVPRRHGGCSR